MENSIIGESTASRILIYLLNRKDINFCFKIAKETGCTQAGVSKTLNILKNLNLIDSNEDGRMKVIKLTIKGKSIAENLNKINNLLNGN